MLYVVEYSLHIQTTVRHITQQPNPLPPHTTLTPKHSLRSTHTYTRPQVHIQVYTPHTCTNSHAHLCTQKQPHNTQSLMYVHSHPHPHTYCTYTLTHIHTCIHIHTQIHTHKHTHTPHTPCSLRYLTRLRSTRLSTQGASSTRRMKNIATCHHLSTIASNSCTYIYGIESKKSIRITNRCL